MPLLSTVQARVVLPRGRSRNCLRARMRGRGGHVRVWEGGGGSAVQSHSMGGVRAEGRDTHTHTEENTHTHTQREKHTRKCCTYPLATYQVPRKMFPNGYFLLIVLRLPVEPSYKVMRTVVDNGLCILHDKL